MHLRALVLHWSLTPQQGVQGELRGGRGMDRVQAQRGRAVAVGIHEGTAVSVGFGAEARAGGMGLQSLIGISDERGNQVEIRHT